MDEDPEIPIPLTQAKSRPITTLKIEYIDDLPEYPTTHLHGYSYVVATKDRSQEEAEQLAQEVF